MHPQAESVLEAIEQDRDEIIDFAADLIRIPTVNPPGNAYRECAELVGARLERFDFDVEYVEALGRPEHTTVHPRVNVVGKRRGSAERPLMHLNGHIDVVPAGDGWTLDPFAGIVRNGKLYGRGSSDMKAGLAAAVYAAETIRRADITLHGSLEISGTVDEESGGFAGVAYLCQEGRLTKEHCDYVIIPEPLDVDRICIGHRGVYWFKVTAHGRIAHGSMPFLGDSAIDRMTAFLNAVETDLKPRLAERTTRVPVVPPGARHATMNVNAVSGGQAGQDPQSPCVADRCEAILDRRFLLEEGFDDAKAEIEELLETLRRTGGRYDLDDLMIVHPVETPESSPLTHALESAVSSVLGRRAERIASPGTYDHKHVTRIGGIEDCVAYGPGTLELAHQIDEYCSVDDLVQSTKVMALAILDLIGRA